MATIAVDRSFTGSDGMLVGIGVFIVAAGIGLGFLRYFNTSELERGFEAAVAAAALASLVMTPGVLVLFALAGRPALLLPAAFGLLPLSVLSLAGVTLPLALPAVFLFVAYGRRSSGEPGEGLEAAGVTILTVTMLAMAAAVLLFLHQDPRSYQDGTQFMSTSDIVTYAESALCLGIVAVTLGLDWWVTQPRIT